MPLSISIQLTESQIEELINQKLASATVTAQAPEYPSDPDPSTFLNGQQYINTTTGLLMVKTPTGFEPVELGSDDLTVNW